MEELYWSDSRRHTGGFLEVWTTHFEPLQTNVKHPIRYKYLMYNVNSKVLSIF